MFRFLGYLRSLYWFIRFTLQDRRIPNHHTFLRAVYQGMLQREIDDAGLSHYHQALQAKKIGSAAVVLDLARSAEYQQRHAAYRHALKRFGIIGAFGVAYGASLLKERRWPNDASFLRVAYRALLKREPDSQGLQSHLHALQSQKTTRRAIIHTITQSGEFNQLYRMPIDGATAQHLSRMQLVRLHFPPARRVLDLGGAAHNHAEGALRALGYPYLPQAITIVDLPPAERIGGVAQSEASQELVAHDGVVIRYLYRSMADLSDIADASYDLVVSGQSIEHVSAEEGALILREVYRILQPGGYLCIETPNAALTRLQSPHQLIHPEHQKEYYVHELEQMIEKIGFAIVERKGISPMPHSYGRGVFDPDELAANIGLCDAPEQGYLFFLKARKLA